MNDTILIAGEHAAHYDSEGRITHRLTFTADANLHSLLFNLPAPKSRLIDVGDDGIGCCRLCPYTYAVATGWQLPNDPLATGRRP
ncbi:hypothetical protein GS432_19480 [Rhodococcus hoagii]|nr:hypothetical protein [Prescottella equi]MBM4577742.1 hypothetical protein [Prescottella equi]